MGLGLFVSTRFQGLFHSAFAVLFTFPSRYWCTIGRQVCLALEGGPPGFPRDSSCPVVLGIRLWFFPFRLQGCYLLWPAFPGLFG